MPIRWHSSLPVSNLPPPKTYNDSALRAEHDNNYGAVFSIWDRLFGTLREQEPLEIGLKGVDEQQFVDLVRYGFTTRIQFQRKPAFVAARERV